MTQLEVALDPGTIRHLETLGVRAGWQCLEVGGGGGSIADWLCRRVGPDGHVLTTDLDTRFLAVLDQPNLEVRRHDIVTDALPQAAFDLVHTRMVLTHLPARGAVLDRLVAALKPGAWLLVEEIDWRTFQTDQLVPPGAAELFGKFWQALEQVLQTAGADLHYGRRLNRDVCARGLIEVAGEGRLAMVQTGAPWAQVIGLTAEELGERLTAGGLLTQQELDNFIAVLDQPDVIWTAPLTMAVWGRRPA